MIVRGTWDWNLIKVVAADPECKEPGHLPYARGLTQSDCRRIVRSMEAVPRHWGMTPTGATIPRT